MPKEVWTHLFVHALDTIPNNWYIELEVCIRTTVWEEMTKKFKVKLSFENNNPLIELAF